MSPGHYEGVGPRLSESFDVDSRVVKVSGQSRDLSFKIKNAIHKEMPSRVAGRN